MKVEKQVSIFVGDRTKSQRNRNMAEEKKENRKTIFAGEWKQAQDPIAQKRKEAREKAMKVVGDTFANERKIDEDLKARTEHIGQLQAEIGNAEEALKQIADEKAACLERGDLEEYEQRSKEWAETSQFYQGEIETAKQGIIEENAIIGGMKSERLKTHPMLDARKQADAIMDAASDEIKGMLVAEAKDHIDEEMREKQEAAEKKAEEEKKQEEQLEAIKEKKEEMEQLANREKREEDTVESVNIETVTENILEMDHAQKDVQKEVEQIVDKMKLVAEDIKGVVVDSKL